VIEFRVRASARVITAVAVALVVVLCGALPAGAGDPVGQVTEFTAGLTPNSGPNRIAAGPDGNLWFTQNLRGNIARISQDGVITEASKAVDFADPKRPDPIGITIGANGNPWYAESRVASVATLKLR